MTLMRIRQTDENEDLQPIQSDGTDPGRRGVKVQAADVKTLIWDRGHEHLRWGLGTSWWRFWGHVETSPACLQTAGCVSWTGCRDLWCWTDGGSRRCRRGLQHQGPTCERCPSGCARMHCPVPADSCLSSSASWWGSGRPYWTAGVQPEGGVKQSSWVGAHSDTTSFLIRITEFKLKGLCCPLMATARVTWGNILSAAFNSISFMLHTAIQILLLLKYY